MGTASPPSAAHDTRTYIVRIWKSGGFIAALRRVDEETAVQFDDAVSLSRYLEAESAACSDAGVRGQAPSPLFEALKHERTSMSSYLLIESRDPYSFADMRGYALATQLRQAGHEVALFLVQNGVLPVRDGAHCPQLRDAIGAHVEVLADEFSLRERGIEMSRLAAGVRGAPIGVVVERLAAGWKTIWH
jgi:hypothetical protein